MTRSTVANKFCSPDIGSSESIMVSLLTTTVRNISLILQTEEKPLGAKNVIVKDIKNGIKVQKLTAQKDFLEICLKKKVFPKDIMSTAKSLARNDDKKYKIETKRITKDRIREKARDIRIAKDNWNKSTRERKTSLKLSKKPSIASSN